VTGFVPLDGGWRLLTHFFLRGTGFPIERALAAADPELAAAADRAIADDSREARAALHAEAAAAAGRTSHFLRRVASEPDFAAAVAWQNRAAHANAVTTIRAGGDMAGSRRREREAVLWSYLQRYATKNDTVGFFGPIGWGQFADRPGLEMRPGPALMRRRETYFEYWGIDLLAEASSADRAARASMAPRRVTAARLDGTVVRVLVGQEFEIPPAYARLLELCDGATPGARIAERLAAEPELGVESQEQVLDMLDELVESGLVLWRVEVPLGGARHERVLRRVIESIADPDARDRAAAALGELEAARDRVARAAGDDAALVAALGELDRTFERLTERAATRRAGKSYAARTLVVEDGLRDLDLLVGSQVAERAGPPLGLLLESARWLTHAIAVRYRERLAAAYDELRVETGADRIELSWLADRVAPLFSGSSRLSPPIIAELEIELRERWARVLDARQDERRIERTADALWPRVRDDFAAPGAGWPAGRWHSPDLLIAADSAEAISRGEFALVLGELHLSVIGPGTGLALREHPDLEQVARPILEASPEPRVAWVASAREALRTNHSQGPQIFHDHPHFVELETSDGRSSLPRERVLAVADFQVERAGDRLVARARRGEATFDLLDLFASPLAFQTCNSFGLLPPWSHAPRVTIDGMVVARETWRFEPDAFAFCQEKDPAARFLGARRFSRAHDLPRFLFARTPEELKPIYLDLDAPIAVELLCKMLRRASRLAVSEMLPRPDQVWLADHAGRRYSCELRTAAIDPRPWSRD
jgi:hypothetical protein